MTTGIILLAAGSSTRMGSPKQLLEYDGKPLVRHAAEVALASSCRPIFIVVGAQSDAVRAALDNLPVEILENPRWEEGMGTSIGVGVDAALARGLDGVVLGLADQPLITSEILDGLVAKHRESGRGIVASRYAGTLGVPVFFTREFFPNLMALQPAQGCKGIILSHQENTLPVDCPEGAIDIDTPQDYRQLAIPKAEPGSGR